MNVSQHSKEFHERRARMDAMSSREHQMVMDARIAAAGRAKPLVISCEWGGMGLERVVCKCCGTEVRKLVPDDRFVEKRIINDREVLAERLLLMTLPMYNEVAIFFDDGSRHITLVCAECTKEITKETLEWHYMSDVAELMRDGGWHPDMARHWAHRIPVDFAITPKGQVTP